MLTKSLCECAGYQTVESTGFGWNVGGPSQHPAPTPSYDYSSRNNQDCGEPGVHEEVVQAKEAGAMSFAHYIVRWVSRKIFS
jgi:hypothetical protein